jgi:hypothetical protein
MINLCSEVVATYTYFKLLCEVTCKQDIQDDDK